MTVVGETVTFVCCCRYLLVPLDITGDTLVRVGCGILEEYSSSGNRTGKRRE